MFVALNAAGVAPMVVKPKTTAFTATEIEHMAAIFFCL
jgi:hypothetical protein